MLPLTVELAEGVNIFTGFTPKTKKKDQPHLSKAQKKQLKIDKEVEREMKMAEAEESREHKRYNVRVSVSFSNICSKQKRLRPSF